MKTVSFGRTVFTILSIAALAALAPAAGETYPRARMLHVIADCRAFQAASLRVLIGDGASHDMCDLLGQELSQLEQSPWSAYMAHEVCDSLPTAFDELMMAYEAAETHRAAGAQTPQEELAWPSFQPALDAFRKTAELRRATSWLVMETESYARSASFQRICKSLDTYLQRECDAKPDPSPKPKSKR